MDSAQPTRERLQEVLSLLQAHVEQHYQVPVRIIDVPDPYSGDLNGEEIHLDYEEDPDVMVFNLVHLFGHTVQWNLLGRAPEIGSKAPGTYTEPELEEVVTYEREACRYGQQLLHEAGIHDLDGWLSDFAATDEVYLLHYYRTGEKRPPRSFWRTDHPLLEPLRIPRFHPTKFKLRANGVVI